MELSWNEFQKVDMRVGTIVQVDDLPEVRNPAYKLHIDFGEEIGIKKTSAQLTTRYSKDDLLNQQVVAVVNFPKKQIATMMSECLVLGAVNGKDITIIKPEAKIENGLRIG